MDAALDRDLELTELDRRLGHVRAGAGRVIVVEGPAGIGKSTVLAAASRSALVRGMIVLRAVCSPLGQDAAWDVVRQLLDPLQSRPDWRRLHEGQAELADPVMAVAHAEPVRGVDTMHAVVRGLTCLVGNLARRAPVLLVVDDVHWADPPSVHWLVVLAATLPQLPIGLLCAVRSGERPAAPDLVAELVAAADAPVRPRPLSLEATRALVAGQLPHATPAFAAACHSVTGGNPFLLNALVRHVVAEGLAPDDSMVDRLDTFGPVQVLRALDRQLARLSPEAGPLARAIAVLGPSVELRHAARLARLDLPTAARTADSLRNAGLMGSGPQLALTHPLVTGALYTGLPSGERALWHGRAAALLAAERADPERVATHLVRTEPAGDASTVAQLRAAADVATARGAPQSAATYLRRALLEPPDAAADEADVRLQLGLALAAYMSPDAFEGLHAMLRTAVGVAPTAVQRGRIALDGARALGLLGHFVLAVDLLRRALVDASEYPPDLRERLEAELVCVGVTDASSCAEARDYAARRGPTVLRLGEVAAACVAMLGNTSAAETMHLLLPALEADVLAAEVGSVAHTVAMLTLGMSDELDAAVRLCSALIELAHVRGWRIAEAHGSIFRAFALLRAGRVRDAAADARAAFDAKLPVAPRGAMLWSLAPLVDALVEAGDCHGADEALAAVLHQGDPPAGSLAAVLVLQARARLRLAQHQPRAALADALSAQRRAAEFDLRHAVFADWRTAAAEASVLLGQPEAARRFAEEQVALAEELGMPGAIGGALRVLARTDHAPLRLLERAVPLLAGSPARLEHVRALVDLGAALRRANRRTDARTPLRLAQDLAGVGGMELLGRRAREELLACGARPRRVAVSGLAALTPAERRVALLAAQGTSNRGIAGQLYVTQRTVETHLTHAFAKLHITARSQLTAVLGSAPPGDGARVAW